MAEESFELRKGDIKLSNRECGYNEIHRKVCQEADFGRRQYVLLMCYL